MPLPLMTRSANTASTSESESPTVATRMEKIAVVENDARYVGSFHRSTKFSKPTQSTEVPKASARGNASTSAWRAGQKKNMAMMVTWGASSPQGSHEDRKTTRFS